jgi:hypothetical protein
MARLRMLLLTARGSDRAFVFWWKAIMEAAAPQRVPAPRGNPKPKANSPATGAALEAGAQRKAQSVFVRIFPKPVIDDPLFLVEPLFRGHPTPTGARFGNELR